MNRYDTPVLLQRAYPYILLAEDSYYYFTTTVPGQSSRRKAAYTLSCGLILL